METSSFTLTLHDSDHEFLVKSLKSKGEALFELVRRADRIRDEQVGDNVTFVRNQNINFSNICYVGCRFCAFSAHENEPHAYRMSFEEIRLASKMSRERGVTEICATAGIDPYFRLEDYLHVLKIFKKENPGVHVHAFSPFEVYSLAKKENLSYEEVLQELMKAGLNSLAGTAAEILVDSVRKVICPNKLKTAEWIEIIMLAHSLGLPTTSTIMYGHVETVHDQATHLQIIKAIQEETRGFTEFIPLPFVHHETKLFKEYNARPGSTGREDLALLATSRLFLGEVIRNLQVSWVKTGVKFAQMGLYAGANDFGGTLFEENISRSAGASHGTFLNENEIIRLIHEAGRSAARRTTLYKIIERFESKRNELDG